MIQKKKITAFIAIILCLLFVCFSFPLHASPSFADTTFGDLKLDETNVLDDLEGMTIDGVPFSLSNYGFDEDKETSVFSFVEYCYSSDSNLLGNYGLFVYIYNPKGLTFDTSVGTISLRISKDDNPFATFNLLYCNQCEKTNYEGLFLKFKVNLSAIQKKSLFKQLDSSARSYYVGAVYLRQSDGIAIGIQDGTEYVFSGYAKGYGANASAECTLTCHKEQREILQLSVEPTVYTSATPNGTDLFSRDSLHSVYFCIGKKYREKYGEISSIHATWLEATLQPELVTGNVDAYSAIFPYLGKDIGEHSDSLNYAYLGAAREVDSGGFHFLAGGYAYNLPVSTGNHGAGAPTNRISTLYSMYYSGQEKNSADLYDHSASAELENLFNKTEDYGGDLVEGKYSSCLFESVADEKIDVTLKSTDELKIASSVLSTSFWNRWFFGYDDRIESTTYDGIPVLQLVESSDLTGDKTIDCENLKIDSFDYTFFTSALKDCRDEEDLYLFHYNVSTYRAEEATLYEKGTNLLGVEVWNEVDTNAYFYQRQMDLGFTIIDIGFSNGEKTVVVPVAMDPIDVVGGANHPTITTNDNKWWEDLLEVLKKMFGVLMAALLIVGIVWLVPRLVDTASNIRVNSYIREERREKRRAKREARKEKKRKK